RERTLHDLRAAIAALLFRIAENETHFRRSGFCRAGISVHCRCAGLLAALCRLSESCAWQNERHHRAELHDAVEPRLRAYASRLLRSLRRLLGRAVQKRSLYERRV